MKNEVSAERILHLRMANQRISTTHHDANISGVVEHLFALQAQDFSQALWALGCRAQGSSALEVDAALDTARVVRSWPMRGTLHWVRPDDLRLILSVTAERSLTAIGKRRADLGLDRQTLDRAAAVTLDLLHGGGAAERSEFMTALEEAGIATTGQRGPHLISYLAQTGVVCWGPRRGKAQALVLLDEWSPPQQEVSRDEALRQMAFRYFRGHGPATVKDFIWWCKITVTDAKRALALAAPELTELQCNGRSYWIGTDALQAIPAALEPEPQLYLLPGFDEYLLGYQDRGLALAAEHSQLIVPGNNGIFLPIIVSGGRVVGTWRRENRTTEVVVKPQPFRPLHEREIAAVEREAQRYGQFSGRAAVIQHL